MEILRLNGVKNYMSPKHPYASQGGPCGESTCKVCNICTHGFKLRDNVGDTARRTAFPLRYGNGLYFSSVSGKANDYAQESEKVGGGS